MLELMTVMFIIATMASIMVPTIKRAMWKAQVTGCATNTRNMATALQVYANDYEGLYPDQLVKLEPKYIRSVPTCPSAMVDTYSPGYTVSSDAQSYTICCKGHNHAVMGLKPDEPYYDLFTGLNPR